MVNRHWKAVARMHAIIVVGVPVGLVTFAVDLCNSVTAPSVQQQTTRRVN
jgi:hypothetical protein